MTIAKHGYCPSCGSGWIRNRYGRKWDCRTCDAKFDTPADVVKQIVLRPVVEMGDVVNPTLTHGLTNPAIAEGQAVFGRFKKRVPYEHD